MEKWNVHQRNRFKMNTASRFLTPHHSKVKEKEKKYKEKIKAKWLGDLSIREVKHLKSSLSQAFVTTQLQIECIDTIFEIQGVDRHFPLLKDYQAEMLKLESELRSISIKDESDDKNRLDFEKMIEDITSAMPKMGIKQLKLLREYSLNLINK